MRLRSNRTLILALLVAIGTSYYYFDLLIPRSRLRDAANQMGGPYGFGGDFYPIWLTGRALLFQGTNPYTPEMTRAIQIGLFGRPMDSRRPADPPTDFRAFAYPIYVDLLMAPLLPFRFEAVRIVLGVAASRADSGAVCSFGCALFGCSFRPARWPSPLILFLVSYPVSGRSYTRSRWVCWWEPRWRSPSRRLFADGWSWRACYLGLLP